MKMFAVALTVAIIVSLVALWWGVRSPPPAPVPQRGGTLLDVTLIEPGVRRLERHTLTIDGGVITAIEPASDVNSSKPSGYVLPGLTDMHVHQPLSFAGFEEYFALLFLSHGVTSVRETGYAYPAVFERRGQINAGAYPGPRIFTCGPILDGEPPLWENATVVADPRDAEPIVSRLSNEGVDCIKVYSNLAAEVLAAIHAAADVAGLPVIGHVPPDIAFEQARLDDAQHLIGVADASQDPAGTNPLVAGWNSLTQARINHIVDASREYSIAHTPTLVFLDYNARRNQPDLLMVESGADFMPRVFPDYFWQPEEAFRLGGTATDEFYQRLRHAYQNSKQVVYQLHRQGVTLHAGTDTGNPFVVPGVSLWRELELMVEAGLTPEEALATATTNPGMFFEGSGIGGIRVGAPADLLLFREDPTLSLAALESLDTIMVDGRIYKKELLEADVRRYQQHFHDFTWDRIVPLLAQWLD